MKQKVGKLRLLLLSVLSLIVCIAASTFVGINFGDKLFVSADALEKDENGNIILEDEKYFDISGTTLNGLSAEGYKVLGCSVYSPQAIKTHFVVKVPDKVTNMAGLCFSGCRALYGIEFPENMVSLGDHSIRWTNVTKLHVPAKVNSANLIGANVYLESITVDPDNTTYKDINGECLVNKAGTVLYKGTGAAAQHLTDDEYSSITTLAQLSFSCEKGFTDLTIPKNVTTIGNYAFQMSSLQNISVDSENEKFSVENNCLINSNGAVVLAAGGDDGIVNIPEGTEEILANACSLLNNKIINVPASLTKLGIAAFNAPYLEDVIVADDHPYLYSNDQTTGNPLHCVILRETDDSGEFTGKEILHTGTANKDMVVPKGVSEIGARAFQNMFGLTEFAVSSSVTVVGAYAFQNSGLEKLTIHNNIGEFGDDVFGLSPYYGNEDNWDGSDVFYVEQYLVSVSKLVSGKYTVRAGTSVIVGGSFQNCTSLEYVEFPDSVTYIGGSAFVNCTKIIQINLSASNKTKYEAEAFAGAEKAKIVAPNYEIYQKVAAQVVTNKANLTYETTVTVTVGRTKANLTKLANNKLGYKKASGGLWTNSGAFEVGGIDISDVAYWTINDGDTHYTTAQLASYKLPIDGSTVAITAYAADDTTNIPVTLVKPEATDLEITYGNSEQFSAEEEYEGFSYSTMKVTYQGEGYAESEQIPYECGEYTVTVYPMTADWKDTSDRQAYVIGTLTIKPAEVQVIWLGAGESTSDFEYVYDGKSHLPTAYFIDVNGDKVWLKGYISVADGNGIAAATYTAQLVIGENDFTNYTFNGSTERSYTVAQREVVVTWSEETLFDYTGHSVVPELSWTTDYNDGSFTVEYSLTAKDGSELTDGKAVKPGEYTITLTLTGSDNYCIAESSLTFEFTIDEPGAGIIYWENVEFAYDGTIKLPTAFYYDPLNDNEKTFITEGVIGGAYNAGTHTAKISAWVLAKYNLKGVTECKYTILKKEVNIEWDIELEFVYNGKLQKPVAFITGVNGERIMLDVTVDGGIDAGEYTAIVSAQTFANYAIVGGDYEKVFNIEKKTLTAVWTGSEFEYDGTEQTATFSIAGYNGSTTVEYYTLSGEKLGGKPVEAGTYVMKVTLDDTNYELTNGSFTFSIEPIGSITTKDGGINGLVIGLIIAIGTVALISLIALFVALRRRKAEDDDGFNDLAYDNDGFYEDYNG